MRELKIKIQKFNKGSILRDYRKLSSLENKNAARQNFQNRLK